MTGQLIFLDKGNITAGGHSWNSMSMNMPNKYSHIIFEFKDKSKLFFNDMRQFGYMRIVEKEDKDKIIKGYGIEPLQNNFTINNFIEALKNKKVAIKTFLLNQKIISQTSAPGVTRQ